MAMIYNDGTSKARELLQEKYEKARALAKQRDLEAIRSKIEAKGTDEGEQHRTDEGRFKDLLAFYESKPQKFWQKQRRHASHK